MTNLEKLRTATPDQIADIFCGEYCEDCDVCPSFIRERCGIEKNGFLEWLNKEAKIPENASKHVPRDAPKGWVKLETMTSVIYIDASKIVCLSHGIDTVSGELTSMFTIGSDKPWSVYGSIDEIMEKIEKAYS